MADVSIFHCPESNAPFTPNFIEFEQVCPLDCSASKPRRCRDSCPDESLDQNLVPENSQLLPAVKFAGGMAFDMACGGWNVADILIPACPDIVPPFRNHPVHHLDAGLPTGHAVKRI
ncbi:hypothetical protein HOY80DRAFT_1137052 [Tuber brumale]|nr:hypothetical protein HOY80DRAFT_1137052 [Tuber brumale]